MSKRALVVESEILALYSNNPEISNQDFLVILRKLQQIDPFLRYDSDAVFTNIFDSMSSQAKVTVESALFILQYLSEKNAAEITANFDFYRGLVNDWNQKGVKQISVYELKAILKAQPSLNTLFRDKLLVRFESLNRDISILKFEAFLDQLEQQIKSLLAADEPRRGFSIVQQFDIEKTEELIRDRESQGTQIKNMNSVKSVASLKEEILSFFMGLEFSTEDKQLIKSGQNLKSSLLNSIDMLQSQVETANIRLDDKLRQNKELFVELSEARTKVDMLDEEKELLLQRNMWLEKDISESKENTTFMAGRIRELTAEVTNTRNALAKTQKQLKDVLAQNNQIKSALKNLPLPYQDQDANQEVEFQDLQAVDKRLKRDQSLVSSFSLQQRTVKQQLQDAEMRILHLQQDLEEKQLEIKAYTRMIEELEFKLSRFNNKSAKQQNQSIISSFMSQNCPVAHNLREEGIQLSTYQMSKVHRGDISQSIISTTKMNEGRRISSVFHSPLTLSARPLKDQKAFTISNPESTTIKIDKILQKSVCQFDLQLSRFSLDPNKGENINTPQKLSTNTEQNFKKKKPVLSPNIYVDVEDQLYKHDFCGLADIEKVKEIIDKDKSKMPGLTENHSELKLRILTTDAKIIRRDGTIFNYTMLLTCANIYFIAGSKYSEKDNIPINQISKILLLNSDNNVMVIKFGRPNDMVIQTNCHHRALIVDFIQQVRKSQQDPLFIQFTDMDQILVFQNRVQTPLDQFAGLKYSYCQWLQYSRYSGYISIYESGWGSKSQRSCFLVVNDSGMFFLENDTIQNKGKFIQKLIMFLPILPTLNCVQFGSKDEKLIRLRYESTAPGTMKDRDIRAKSANDVLEIVSAIGEVRKHLSRLKHMRDKEEMIRLGLESRSTQRQQCL